MEFLFENPIILVIVIGIISSIFKRLTGGRQEEGKPKQQRPYSPSTQPINPLPVERPKTVKPVGAHKQASKPVNEILLEARKSVEQASREVQFERPKSTRDVSTRLQEKTRLTTKSETHPHKLEETRLIDGFIWSEVLGPPRAKKPHTAMKQPYKGRNY